MINLKNTIFGKKYAQVFPVQAEYQAILDQAVSLGYALPATSQQQADNAIVYYLKAEGLWNEIDVLYIFNRPSAQQNFTKLNWKNPASFQLTSTASPAFVDGQGWVGNGSTYWSTNFAPSVNGVKFLFNDLSLGAQMFGAVLTTGSLWGCRSTSGNNLWQNNQYVNLSSGTGVGVASGPSVGFNFNTKNGSTGTRYVNGVLTNTATYTSAALNNRPMYLLCYNLNGTASQFANGTGIGNFLMGSKFLETKQLKLHQILNGTYNG